jgi:hypothetical protein
MAERCHCGEALLSPPPLSPRKSTMHDIDRVRLETETEAFESGEFEAGNFEFNETGEVFSETENMELASEMLEVSSEAELEQFLGDLVAKAGRSLGQFVGSPQGQALVGVLRGAARQVLPTLGSAVGGYLGGDTGSKLGAQAASAAGRAFGLELEGLSNEDREFEVARRFVNFAGEAVRNLSDNAVSPQFEAASISTAVPAGASLSLAAAAQKAALAAAQTHAPGLQIPKAKVSFMIGGRSGGKTGRWVRDGSKIILFGV